MSERPRQTNCQQEPPYPGAGTVVFSVRYPHLTVHEPTQRCWIQEPHETTDCGEWGLETSEVEPS